MKNKKHNNKKASVLIISTNQFKLHEFEFVLPIVQALKAAEKLKQICIIVKHYKSISKNDLNKACCIIIAGTALKDNEYMQHVKLFDWLKHCNKPVLGICAGMQIIAKIFDQHITRKKRIGVSYISLTHHAKHDELLNNIKGKKLKVYELHNFAIECKSIDKSNNFLVLAKSRGIAEIIKHKTKPIYGVLFHPEVLNKELLQLFCFLAVQKVFK